MMGKASTTFASLGFLLMLCALHVAEAQALCTVSIGATNFATIQAAINSGLATPGTTIVVSGTCNENVFFPEGKDRITLDGQSTATTTINGPDATSANVLIHSRGVTIKRFTITGGRQGVFVQQGGSATIDGNIIQSVGLRGIQVNTHSFVVVINNTIQNNPDDGIRISENSSAYIGFIFGTDATASPNTIQNNVGRGVQVTDSSTARIAGNTISNNGDDGIGVATVSQVDASNNIISNNGGDGIFVSENSGVNLGNDTGTTFLDLPNSTPPAVLNVGFGIRCTINSYGDGRFGTLTGASGQSSFTSGCVNSVNP
jgi:parallel beta-helix repeat protein